MGAAALSAWIYRRLEGLDTAERLFVTLVLGFGLLLAFAVVAVVLHHLFGWHTPGPPG